MAFGHTLIGTMLAQLCGKKSLFKIACSGPFGDLSLLSSFRFGKEAIEILKTTDAIVAISREVKDELISYGFSERRIHLIPNGVNTSDFQRETPYEYPSYDTPFRFVLPGRRCPQKGIDTTIKAIGILKNRGCSRRFIVELYGNDYPEYDYQSMAKEAGIADYIQFSPYNTDMKKLLNAVHCFILPSRGEGLSNAMLEAMSMELPVIVSRVSGTEDVVTDRRDGLLIAPDSPEQLAEAMSLILNDRSMAEQLRHNARARVSNSFSLDVVADRYRKLYENLLTGNKN
jgi:glycosyltransferase involved in cell wall biosynthesis